MKIIVAILGVIVLFGVLSVAGIVYVGYRAKQKIAEIKQEYGVGEATPAAGQAPARMTPAGSGCPLLSGQEASRLLGIAIERVESKSQPDSSEVCEYYISMAERRRIAGQQVTTGVGTLGHSNVDDKQGAKEAERIVTGAVNALANYAAMQDQDKGPSFTVEIQRTGGKEKWTGIEAANSMMQTVEGLGEKNYVLLGGMGVFVLKGDATLALTFRTFAPGPEKAVAVARQIAGRM
jgi:hypothetical protein